MVRHGPYYNRATRAGYEHPELGMGLFLRSMADKSGPVLQSNSSKKWTIMTPEPRLVRSKRAMKLQFLSEVSQSHLDIHAHKSSVER